MRVCSVLRSARFVSLKSPSLGVFPLRSSFNGMRLFSETPKAEEEKESIPEEKAESIPEVETAGKEEEPIYPETEEHAKIIEIDESVLVQKDTEIRELKEKYLRALAEVDNVRRRSHLDINTFKKFAISGFASDLLVIADNLGLALNSVEKSGAVQLMENDSEESKALKSLYEGLLLTSKDLQNRFEAHHIKKIESVGHKFNPNMHEVLFEVEDPEKEAGTITSVIKEGYTLHERVLRAAQVGTVKAK